MECCTSPKQAFKHLSYDVMNILRQAWYFGCTLQNASYNLRTRISFFQVSFQIPIYLGGTVEHLNFGSLYCKCIVPAKSFADGFGSTTISSLATNVATELFIHHDTWKPFEQNRSPRCRVLYRESFFFVLKSLNSV